MTRQSRQMRNLILVIVASTPKAFVVVVVVGPDRNYETRVHVPRSNTRRKEKSIFGSLAHTYMHSTDMPACVRTT